MDALMRTRDGIAGAEQIVGAAGAASGLDMGARLYRLDLDYREAVIASELLEDISFDMVDYNPAQSTAQTVTVLRRAAAGGALNATYTPLASITRPGLDTFQQAVALVGHYAELRADRAAEIDVQTEELVAFFASVLPVEPSRSDKILEMLDMAQDIATFVVMRVKLALGCPRPGQFSDLIQPMIACPNHATLPSGHATQAFTLATVLTLMQDPAAGVPADSQLYRLACRIAINRTVAGVHFPADSAAGAVLGIQLGRYLMARGRAANGAAGTVGSASFDGTAYTNTGDPRDFHYAILNTMTGGGGLSGGDGDSTDFAADASDVRPAPLWGSLTAAAIEEWGQRWS